MSERRIKGYRCFASFSITSGIRSTLVLDCFAECLERSAHVEFDAFDRYAEYAGDFRVGHVLVPAQGEHEAGALRQSIESALYYSNELIDVGLCI